MCSSDLSYGNFFLFHGEKRPFSKEKRALSLSDLRGIEKEGFLGGVPGIFNDCLDCIILRSICDNGFRGKYFLFYVKKTLSFVHSSGFYY